MINSLNYQFWLYWLFNSSCWHCFRFVCIFFSLRLLHRVIDLIINYKLKVWVIFKFVLVLRLFLYVSFYNENFWLLLFSVEENAHNLFGNPYLCFNTHSVFCMWRTSSPEPDKYIINMWYSMTNFQLNIIDLYCFSIILILLKIVSL